MSSSTSSHKFSISVSVGLFNIYSYFQINMDNAMDDQLISMSMCRVNTSSPLNGKVLLAVEAVS